MKAGAVTRALPVLAATALVAAAVSGCSSEPEAAGDDGTVRIVTSTNVYADIARQVAGDEAEVSSFIDSPSVDPHSFESDTRDILAVTDADLVIENGGGYDDFIDQLVEAADSDPVVLNAVEIAGVEEEHAADEEHAGEEEHAEEEHADEDDHGHDHGSVNEHVWYDVAAMQDLTAALGRELAELDPDNADTYTANAEDLESRLDTLLDEQAELSTSLGGAPVAVSEPVPGYLVEALGLRDLTPPAFSQAIEEGDDVSVAVLAQTLDLFSTGAVDALVYNEQTTGPTTEQVEAAADEAGVPVVGVTETLPDGEDYVSWMASNIDAVAEAVRSR
jgi:zinc/manganese transport system substrate-binding protein